jgi:OOP family OmpA-OmpF porin
MNRPVFKLALLLMIAALMSACATSSQPVPPFTPVNVAAGGHALKTQNAVVILDTSSSMAEGYQQRKKIDLATAVVRNLSATIPGGIGIKSGLRTFGHDHNFSKDSTKLIQKMGDFDKAAQLKALDSVVKAGGPSLLNKAIDGAAKDLDGLSGNSAMIIVSDGKPTGKNPIAAATALKEKLGDALCIYPILVGDDAGGKALLDEIAKIGGCGFATNADDLASGPQMAEFVKKVFIGDLMDSDGDGVANAMDKCPGTPAGVKVDAAGCPLDSDKDGVPDYLDKCPGTPVGIKVDSNGCPLDSDADGVPDSLDKCPGTPAGMKVDASGCPKTVLKTGEASWTFNNIYFDFDKATILPASYGILDEITAALMAKPHLTVEVDGHTDSTGPHDYNMTLSDRRAKAVVDYLVGKGIKPSRLSSKGFGPDRPIADNATKLGRAKNRRVEFTKIE